MKKIIIILLSVLFITGCSNEKTPITATNFKNIVNNFKYEVSDVTEYYDYANNVLEYTDSNTQILFMDGDNGIVIKGVYSDECSNIKNNDGKDSEEKIIKGDNYSSFEIETKSTYYYLAWVKDSYIKVKCPINKKSDMKEMIKELGY